MMTVLVLSVELAEGPQESSCRKKKPVSSFQCLPLFFMPHRHSPFYSPSIRRSFLCIFFPPPPPASCILLMHSSSYTRIHQNHFHVHHLPKHIPSLCRNAKENKPSMNVLKSYSSLKPLTSSQRDPRVPNRADNRTWA